jgi:hypothetical protein
MHETSPPPCFVITDAPYRETPTAIGQAETAGVVAVEMEAAALDAERRCVGQRRRGRLGLVAVAVVGVALVGCGGGDRTDRQAEVAERGATVMPFDLEATTHTFTNTDDGGVQTVTADDPSDVAQIDLIRDHLHEERDKFARGNFDDPAAIHGHDMDGVAELRAGYTDIAVTYTDLLDGAQLSYTTENADLVQAIHAWFDRQLMDHGADARAG